MGLFSRKKKTVVDSGPSKRASRIEADRADAEESPDVDENAADESAAASSAEETTEGAATQPDDVPETRRSRRRREAEQAGKATGKPAAEPAGTKARTDDDGADKSAPTDRADSGPYDAAEDAGRAPRVDLGSLQIPAVDGMQLGLDVDENQERIVSVTCDFGESTLQLQAFAAPRSEGLWHEIRHQIAASVTKQGGTADTSDTSFGPEVLARIPSRTGDGRTGVRQARFVGVDGPRWFLRAVIGGEALTDDRERETVEDVLRGVVVTRGEEPMAPRDLLPLTPPLTDDESDEEPGAGDELNPFRRGPEITEVH
ncbi:DUF3710 domain-containing protein [Spelaeicoccus albus]|uniref:DUF3710 domain-containing protein n=1 Tax=Spelaeicoccus albus TaxID=1280376 RepID=A0A7Z0II26_9MICO|nr:DUF3710 domain-containing protein [Spelaeicoccus albus]NYI68163.1 hypothetical protein [Spelaeicoccus albus]